MRKTFTTLVLILLTTLTFGQQWVAVKSDTPSTIQTTLVSSSESQITVNLQVPGFYALEVTTPRGEANIISVPKTVTTAAAGEPNLPMIAVPAIVGDRQHYSIRVVETQYIDYPMEVAPSKGDFPRTINPEDVPYTYGEAYSTDAFFPTQNVGLYEPYILRDFRGQNMVVYPFAYNPVSKTLRVYYNMTVEMYSDGVSSDNVFDRRSTVVKMDSEFDAIYDNQFINYHESMSKYTPMVETGHLLIICHDAFMTAMQPFVNWKKQIGRPTTMVGTSTTGTSYSAIQTYIQNQYNANSNISHVLLVGDVTQIPGIPYTAGSGYYNNYSGKSDNMYGQVVGNDLYNDIIIGRFSAETEAHVTTQVNKVIHYERDINASDTWLPIGQGVSRNEGAGYGHYGEADYQHIDNIRDDLLSYNYTTVHRDYEFVSGVSSSAAIISQHINEGVSIINYSNHGVETSWSVFNYSNSNVNALTNVNKLPIVWCVSCLIGKYDHSQPCFGETWLRATNGTVNAPDPTQPTGAVGGMFSYISQPWQPPQYGHDEMVDVLVESYSTNIKRTLGGCSYDGNMKILDQYGQNNNASKGTYLAWILYGDPCLTLRNAIPTNMNVTHASSMSSNATSFTVNATNGNGALATLTRNNEIMGSATINNGTCNITFDAPGQTGTATLTVFGYNKITYIATINITSGSAGGDIIIGNGYIYPCDYLPSHSYYKYALSQQIYTTDELGTAGYISVIGFYNAGVENTTRTYDIYMKPTLKDSFSYADWEIVSDSNLVFSGDVTMQANDWTYITLDPPFAYDGNRNVVLVMDDNTGSYTTSEQLFMRCHIFSTSGAQAIYSYNDYTNYDPSSPPYTCTTQSVKNQLFVTKGPAPTFNVSVSANPNEGGTVTGAGTYIQGRNCTVTATANPGYVFRKWMENGREVSSNASYNFAVTGYRFLVAQFELGSPEDNIVFADTTVKALCVAPATNWDTNGDGELSYAEAAAVTSLGNVFYRKSSITSFDELRYFIGLTSIGNNAFERCTSLASIVLPNSVDSIGNYAFERCDSLTTIELSNSLTYIGEEAFKICGSLTTIEIPNSVTFIKDGAFSQCEGLSSMTVWAENPPALGYYVFNEVNKSIPVYVPCGSLEAYQSAVGWNQFTNIQEVCTQTQTIELVAGWNWFSTNLEITLDELKEALIEVAPGTNILIKSKTQNTVYNPVTNQWRGTLNTLDLTQMYLISVCTNCEIILTGTPINPTEHPITIQNGFNWIEFPLSENMSISNAFEGIVVNGDVIQSKTNNASYINGHWRGNFNTLEPGKGYIYKSNSSEPKTLVY